MKIRPVGAAVLHRTESQTNRQIDRHTDRHDKASSHFEILRKLLKPGLS